MAHFYGTVQGGRGQASRLGHKTTGISATVKNWDAAVTTRLYYDEKEDRDYLRLWVGQKVIYDGPFGPLADGGIEYLLREYLKVITVAP